MYAGDEGVAGFAVRDALGRLVDRSLVVSEVGEDGTSRFRMLETMRMYGREHLRDAGHSDTIRQRHARHMADYVDQLTLQFPGPSELQVLDRLQRLRADIVMAVEWFVEHGEFEQAMRVPPGLVFAANGDWSAMMELIRVEALRAGASAELAAELDLSVLPVRFALTDEETLARLPLISPQPDRDITGGPVDRVQLSDDLAVEVHRYADRFADARPLTRYVAGLFCSRVLIMSGRLTDGAALLDRVEQSWASVDSSIAPTAVMEGRAQTARAEGEWEQAAVLFEEVVRRRGGPLEASNLTFLARFGAIAAHARAGTSVPLSDLRTAWEAVRRSGQGLNRTRSTSATAMWLAARGHRDLAIRFLQFAVQNERGGLKLSSADLEYFELPIDPEPSSESLEELLDELELI